MAEQYYNPFAGYPLRTPDNQRSAYNQYCQRQGASAGIDQKPFPRMVDLWFAGLAIAARKGLQPMEMDGKGTRSIIDGAIFNSDGWRIHTIMLITIATEDDLTIVERPHEMMTIANRLAAAGVPHIVKMLSEGNHSPIWNLSDAIDDLLRSDTDAAEPRNPTSIAEAIRNP